MTEGCFLMSADERERSHLIRATVEGCLGQREAAERAGVSPRHFKRLVRSWRQDGDAGLVSRQRGQRSNHRLADPMVRQIEHHPRETCPDFGPTLACVLAHGRPLAFYTKSCVAHRNIISITVSAVIQRTGRDTRPP